MDKLWWIPDLSVTLCASDYVEIVSREWVSGRASVESFSEMEELEVAEVES